MTILLFIHFVSADIWNWHYLVMYSIYGIEESYVSQDNLCYPIWYICKDKQLRRENCVFLCLLLHRGTTTSWNHLITLFYSLFLHAFIYLAIFHYVSIFNGFIPLVSIYAIVCVYQLTCVMTFKFVFGVFPVGQDLWMLHGLTFCLYKCFLLARIISFNTYLKCDRMAVI